MKGIKGELEERKRFKRNSDQVEDNYRLPCSRVSSINLFRSRRFRAEGGNIVSTCCQNTYDGRLRHVQPPDLRALSRIHNCTPRPDPVALLYTRTFPRHTRVSRRTRVSQSCALITRRTITEVDHSIKIYRFYYVISVIAM